MITELSILIPVFNFDVRHLVEELSTQCRKLSVRYEILLFDDASEEQYRELNRALAGLPHVTYKELPANIGRSAIRNKLAAAAAYPWLLMLDNDCLPAHENFIADYLHEAGSEVIVIGGVAYEAETPARTFRLHWKYGQRAARPAVERQREPYKHIYLSNVLVRKDLFLQFQLCEILKYYGHEDTIFALRLQQHQVPVKYIQNPVVHMGLESTQVFLSKTDQAVDNLVKLYLRGEELEALKLVKAYRFLAGKGLDTGFIKAFGGISKLIEFNLFSSRPSMFFFDLYRLFLFTSKMQNK